MPAWNQTAHPQLVGITIGNRRETAPMRVVLVEDDDGVTLDMVLAVSLDVGVTAARLPHRGETVRVTLHMADKGALQVTGRVDLVQAVWALQPIGEARIRIRGAKVEAMPSIVLANVPPPVVHP